MVSSSIVTLRSPSKTDNRYSVKICITVDGDAIDTDCTGPAAGPACPPANSLADLQHSCNLFSCFAEKVNNDLFACSRFPVVQYSKYSSPAEM